MQWNVDIPNQDRYHVGGSFNNIFSSWPHRYFVVYNGKLVYRSEFFIADNGERFIRLKHLREFLSI